MNNIKKFDVEGNVLIAEFMELKHPKSIFEGVIKCAWNGSDMNPNNWYIKGKTHQNLDQLWWSVGLKYDNDWEWLMEVVDKIQSLRNKVDDEGKQLIGAIENWFKYEHKNGYSKRLLVWSAVVEFIKYKNQKS